MLCRFEVFIKVADVLCTLLTVLLAVLIVFSSQSAISSLLPSSAPIPEAIFPAQMNPCNYRAYLPEYSNA